MEFACSSCSWVGFGALFSATNLHMTLAPPGGGCQNEFPHGDDKWIIKYIEPCLTCQLVEIFILLKCIVTQINNINDFASYIFTPK